MAAVGKGRRRLWRGERLTIWCEETPSPRLSAHVSASLDISRLRWFYSAFRNPWAINEQLTPLTGQVTKAGSSGSYLTDALFHSDLLCVSESRITASIIWSIFAFENAAVWWGLFMMRTASGRQPPICLYIVFSLKSIKLWSQPATQAAT